MPNFIIKTTKPKVEFLVHQGIHQIKTEKYAVAIATFTRALMYEPDYSEALFQRAFALDISRIYQTSTYKAFHLKIYVRAN